MYVEAKMKRDGTQNGTSYKIHFNDCVRLRRLDGRRSPEGADIVIPLSSSVPDLDLYEGQVHLGPFPLDLGHCDLQFFPGTYLPQWEVSVQHLATSPEVTHCDIGKAAWHSNDAMLAAASNPKLAPIQLVRMSHCPWSELLIRIAKNPNTPDNLLYGLSEILPRAVAQNPRMVQFVREKKIHNFHANLRELTIAL
jgi:hypothetical protein